MDKKRIAVFYCLSALPDRQAFEEKVKQTFPYEEGFRVNFFGVDHKEAEVVKSLRSQSATIPIDQIFDESCPQGKVTTLQSRLSQTLIGYRLHSHYVKNNDLEAIKHKVLKWYNTQASFRSHSEPTASHRRKQNKQKSHQTRWSSAA